MLEQNYGRGLNAKFQKWSQKASEGDMRFKTLEVAADKPSLIYGNYEDELKMLALCVWDSNGILINNVWKDGKYIGDLKRMRLIVKGKGSVILCAEQIGFIAFGDNDDNFGPRMSVYYKTELFSGIITATEGREGVLSIDYLSNDKDFLFDIFTAYISAQFHQEKQKEVTEDVGESGNTSIS